MPAARPGATVELPRATLIALCGALVAALLALAFLLGRASARPEPARSVASAPDPGQPAESAPPAERGAPAAQAAPPRAEPEVSQGTAATPPAPAAVADPAEQIAVARYFAQLDELEASAKAWSDPQTLAAQLVQQGAQGDRRGFQELLATARRARESLRALNVPPACREHHAEALALMDEALALLARLDQAMAAQDLGALTGFVATAQALEARTRRLEAQATALKRQYGIAVPTVAPAA